MPSNEDIVYGLLFELLNNDSLFETDCYNDYQLYIIGIIHYYLKNKITNINYKSIYDKTIKELLLEFIDIFNKKTENSLLKKSNIKNAYGGNDCVNGYILTICKLKEIKEIIM